MTTTDPPAADVLALLEKETADDATLSDWARLADASINWCRNGGIAAAMRAEELEREVERLREALTPSADTKAAYIGEFHFNVIDRDEDGEEVPRRVAVPWDTTKEIMAAIAARAALAQRP